MPDSDPSFTWVVQRFFPGARLLCSWALSGGISAEMTALEIELSTGEVTRLVLRCAGGAALRANPNAARDEYRVLEVAYACGLPVPRPLGLDGSGEILPGAYLLTEFLDGAPRFALDAADVAQVAGALAAIHGRGVERVAGIFLPEFADAVGQRLAGDPPARDLALDASGVWEALKAGWPPPQYNPFVLLHGDFWPGNWLWQAGKLAAVVDWEDACLGDPLCDLAIARLDILWIFGRPALERFTAEYLSSTRLDLKALPFWDLWAALRLARLVGTDLEDWAAFFLPYGRADISPRTIRAAYQAFIA